jgi:hypothetical protein
VTAARWCGVCARTKDPVPAAPRCICLPGDPVLPDVLVDVDGWEPPAPAAEEQLDLFGETTNAGGSR